MYRQNYINSLRTELVKMVSDYLSPAALHYGYSDVALETNIKWRPLVLVLGNYSSGKSTLINEFLGADIQATGQAPTDDSFTVITHEDAASTAENVRVVEERDGKFLLNDPEYPFETLRKHGQRFASHFRLKKVNAPFLETLAIIDTPGMLDSITERDRGYDYQEVIGELAQIADLVLVVFDPHKAGTVRESYISIRETLPTRTFEDRLIFVLNRIDECTSFADLLQVYGTLCWNLSQITGRKDIPPIRLTYSPRAMLRAGKRSGGDMSFLGHLENQREELKRAILKAPRHRLDHLATFVETHGERLAHLLEALMNYRRRLRKFRWKHISIGFLVSLFLGAGTTFGLMISGILGGMDQRMLSGVGGGVALILFFLWSTLLMKRRAARFLSRVLRDLDKLTPLENQTRRDSWQAVKGFVHDYLERTAGRFSFAQAKKEFGAVKLVRDRGATEIREALNELAGLKDDGIFVVNPATLPEGSPPTSAVEGSVT
ncbi:MAG: dynamin family protein [Deltaproteobacteria bacterium]|nr:dynamin family protein [Deltaproteobacteria bacterium]